jgi:hypothetical protein
MQQDLEQIFGQAMQMLEQGRNKTEVLSVWKDEAKELEPLLDVVLSLRSLPKKTAPEPAMRRKYILAPSKQFWLSWVHISRFAATSVGTTLLLALILGTGYATTQSAPGEILFSFKKAAEHLQVQLTPNQAEKISLQVEIAQKRLNDAQSALNNSQNDPAKETAALAELSAETTNSINALDQAAKDQNPSLLAKIDHPLATSLVNIASIASQQQTLVNHLSAKNQLDQTAKNVLQTTQENVTKVAEIQKSLQAASNDNGLTKLDSNPSAVTASGTVVSFVNNILTIDQNTFIVDDKTIIKNSDNNKIEKINLAAKQKVLIVGDRVAIGLMARQITLLENPQIGEGTVKGTSTPLSEASTTKATADQSGSLGQLQQDPNTAFGSFIMEDPAPQTDFKN